MSFDAAASVVAVRAAGPSPKVTILDPPRTFPKASARAAASPSPTASRQDFAASRRRGIVPAFAATGRPRPGRRAVSALHARMIMYLSQSQEVDSAAEGTDSPIATRAAIAERAPG